MLTPTQRAALAELQQQHAAVTRRIRELERGRYTCRPKKARPPKQA